MKRTRSLQNIRGRLIKTKDQRAQSISILISGYATNPTSMRNLATWDFTFLRREFQFPAIANDAEIEERILQHLAAAMGSQYQFPRRGDRGGSSSLGGHSRFLVFSPATTPPGPAVSSSLVLDGNENERATIPINASLPLPNDTANVSNHRNSTGQASIGGSETGSSSSEFQAFSDSVRYRFSSLSMRRYREFILRSTRSLKERFAPSHSFSDLGSDVRRDGRNRN